MLLSSVKVFQLCLLAFQQTVKTVHLRIKKFVSRKQGAIRDLPHGARQALSLSGATYSVRFESMGSPYGPRQFACKHKNVT